MELRIQEYSADLLSQIQSFECGTDDWCRHAERWIKSAPPFRGAIESIETHGNKVWLYFVDVDVFDEKYLVGFSSLGKVKWKIPPPDGLEREAAFIPMLAVSLRFQGKPEGENTKHYSDEIMEHVIRVAREQGHRELCLYVHEDNARARRKYEKHGFSVLGSKNSKGNLAMLKVLDNQLSEGGQPSALESGPRLGDAAAL